MPRRDKRDAIVGSDELYPQEELPAMTFELQRPTARTFTVVASMCCVISAATTTHKTPNLISYWANSPRISEETIAVTSLLTY